MREPFDRRTELASPRTAHDRREARMATISAAQHGLVSTTQLAGLGLDSGAIARRVRQGRLHRIHRGVYATGDRRLSPGGVRMAAVLASGPGALVGLDNAGIAWGLLRGTPRLTHIVVPAGSGVRNRAGIRIHRRSSLAPRDADLLDGIPTTSVARTLVDLADHRSPARVRQAFVAAEQARLIDMRAIEDVLDRSGRSRGAAVLRELLRGYDPRWQETLSGLEIQVLDLIARAGLPEPLVNDWVAGRFLVDFLWPDHKLVVEADGGRSHGTPGARRKDARRDHTLRQLGFRVLRLSDDEIAHTPTDAAMKLASALAR